MLWGLSNVVLGAAITQVTVGRTIVVTQGHMKSGLKMERDHKTKTNILKRHLLTMQ